MVNVLENPFHLQDKSILITGASSGIGKAIATEASKFNASLTVAGRDNERLEQTFAGLAGQGHKMVISDLQVEEDIAKIVETVPELDGLVLNAGILKTSLVRFTQSKEMLDLFSVNLFSSALLVKNLLKSKKLKQGSSVVFISSVSSMKAIPGNSLYSASKSAINTFARGMALELAPKQIRVNVILPGMVPTNLISGSSVIDQSSLNEHLKKYPLGRFGKPEDIAHLAVFLLSDLASWMTGSLITIDGGFSLL